MLKNIWPSTNAKPSRKIQGKQNRRIVRSESHITECNPCKRLGCVPQSAESGNYLHKTICSRSKCTPKFWPCTRALYEYKLDIGSTSVSYYLKLPHAPKRIRCACRVPLNFSLHVQDLIEFCHALQTGVYPCP